MYFHDAFCHVDLFIVHRSIDRFLEHLGISQMAFSGVRNSCETMATNVLFSFSTSASRVNHGNGHGPDIGIPVPELSYTCAALIDKVF